MKEDFVTYDLAVKLKEKGYNGRTCGRHVEKIPGTEHDEWDDAEMMYVTVIDVATTPRVRIWDAQKWLREDKEIDLVVEPIFKFDNNIKRIREYSCSVFAPQLNKPYHTDYYNSYNQAVLEGIEYVLDKLI